MVDTPRSGGPRRRGSPSTVQSPSRPDTARAQATPPPPGGASDSAVVLRPGTRPLPEYELIQRLGRGGVGEVWKAVGPGGFPVALKFIHLGDQVGQVEMRSLELMRNIRHAHLLALFGAWQRDDFLILAMELGDHTLLDRLHEVQAQGLPGIPADELLEYMHEAAKGLDFLNEPRHPSGTGTLVGIQHQDVKPQNLLLVGGTVKVADFGLAKLLEHTVTHASGRVTPAYAAPELFADQATRWSDQYCLAVTYCHLRGGRLPFEGNAVQVMAGHVTRLPDLRMLPEAEWPAVGRALAKRPTERWPTCRAFVEALAASAQTGRPPTTPFPPTPPMDRRVPGATKAVPRPGSMLSSARRRWKPALVGALGMLVLSLAAVLLWSAFAWSDAQEPGGGSSPPLAGERSRPRAALRSERTTNPIAVASLRLRSLREVVLETGKSTALEVRLERRNCQGSVWLEVAGLPGKVQARPVALAPDRNVARVELTAAEDAGEAAGTARVLANLGGLRAEQPVTVTVKVTPALHLCLLPRVAVQARQTRTLGVWLGRRNCPGPVELRLEDLPEGIEARPVRVPAGAEAGWLELWVRGSAPLLTRQARVVAEAAGVRAETQFRLTVGPPRPPAEWVAEYSQEIEQAPNDPGNYCNRARAYLEQKEYDKASADCDRALQFNPEYVRAYFLRGVASSNKQDYDKAIADYDRAIALDTRFALAYRSRAEAHLKREECDKALEDFDRAIALAPGDAGAFFLRGTVYQDKGEYAQAIEDYSQAIALEPGFALAHNNRGWVHCARGDLELAMEDFDKAIALDPNLALAHYNQGVVYFKRRQYDEALRDFDRAIALNSRFAVAYNARGWIYWLKEDMDRAIADYTQAIRFNSRFRQAYANRSMAYARKGNLPRAEADRWMASSLQH